jgi:hypothetical protein
VDELKGLVPAPLRLLSWEKILKFDESEAVASQQGMYLRNADYYYLLGEVLWLLSQTKRIVAIAASPKETPNQLVHMHLTFLFT